MFALVDVKNFYCSCEQVFDPKLRGKALVVLSNNDGCVIARSAEAKALGIKMGEPWHLLKPRMPKILARSSNYELYGEMSARTVSILTAAAPAVEVYSIDESFLDLAGVADPEDLGRRIREQIREWIGLPVCVGIGSTKTRAKLANYVAKKQPQRGGVFNLDALTPAAAAEVLGAIDVQKVWGIGRRISARLKANGIQTVQDFVAADSTWIRADFSVVLQRTLEELRGQPCTGLELVPSARQQIVVSRSFGKLVTDLPALQQAVSYYISRAAQRLRGEKLRAQYLSVFLETNPFREDLPQYGSTRTTKLPRQTSDTLLLNHTASMLLEHQYRKGFHYLKAGVILSDLTPEACAQQSLFDSPAQLARAERLSKVMDKINQRYGRETLRLGSAGIERSWSMRRERVSPRYTTRWEEIPIALAR